MTVPATQDHLARKIQTSRWRQSAGCASDAIRADALTRDLQTRDDALSWWSCSGEGSTGQPDPPDKASQSAAEVALALAASREHVETIEMVLFARKSLLDGGFGLSPSDGDTPVADLRDRHVDMVGLDADRLIDLARRVAEAARREHPTLYRVTKKQLKHLLAQAVSNGRLNLEDLKVGVQKDVREALGSELS